MVYIAKRLFERKAKPGERIVADIELSQTRSINEWVAFWQEVFDGSIRPQQRSAEIVAILELLTERKPRRMLEISTAEGGTLCQLCRVLDPTASLSWLT